MLRVFLLFLLTTWAPAHAQTIVSDGVVINADKMDSDSRSTRLDGNVQLVFQGQHLSCDRAVLNKKRSTIEAVGNVVLSNQNVHIEGSKVVFNYKNNTGVIYDGFVQSDQVIFEGSLIEKTGTQTYIATDAKYTACATCPPAWSFSGKRIEAELGGYARISRPVFRVAGVPILMLPGMIVPLKSSRQTGVLVPSASQSKKGGLAVSESFFWAINRSRDFTLTATNYELRGPKLMGDYRYVLSEYSKGQLKTAGMQDRQFKSVWRDIQSEPPSGFTRWFLSYDHFYEMPEDYVHRVSLRNVSDLLYFKDFPTEIEASGDPAMENKMSITKNTEDQAMSAEVDMYRNLLKTYPLASNDDAVHRFPELRYSLKETQVGREWGPLLKMEVNYVNFSRNHYSYDDMIFSGERLPLNVTLGPRGEILRDGQFDPDSDLVRTGQRLDLQPAVSYPFQLFKKFDILPTLRYRETQYRFDVPKNADANGFSQTAARRYVETSVAVKAELNHVFGDLTQSNSNRWKHAIEPEVSYSRVPWIRQPNHQFFGDYSSQPYARINEPISNADINDPNRKLQFDYNDRTFNKNVLEFALNNALTKKTWTHNNAEYRTIANLKLSQSYDFYEESSLKPQPWSPILALLTLRLNNFETYTTSSYNPYARITNTSSRMRLFTSPEQFFQVSYTRNVLVNEQNEQIAKSKTENIGLGAGLDTKYVSFDGGLDYSNVTYKIRSWNYHLRIRPPGRCWVIAINHEQALGSDDARIEGSVSFDFGGDDSKKK